MLAVVISCIACMYWGLVVSTLDHAARVSGHVYGGVVFRKCVVHLSMMIPLNDGVTGVSVPRCYITRHK